MAILFLILALVPVSGWAASPAATPSPVCRASWVVETLKSAVQKGRPLARRGDLEGAFQVYRGAALAVLKARPGCEEIQARLEGSLERAASMGRSQDRSQELQGTLDEILRDYGSPVSTPVAGTTSVPTRIPSTLPETASEATGDVEPGDWGTDSAASREGASEDFIYWMTDPYFLALEILFLLILYLIREVRRSRRMPGRPPPPIAPFRYRVLPNRPLPGRRRGS